MDDRPAGFEPATEADGPALLEMIEAGAAPGSIELLYTRRPNPVLSYRQESDEVSLGVVRGANGSPQLMEATIYRDYYINGQPVKAGYIGGVRRKAGARPRCNWLRGMLEYESANCNDFYCSILEGNPAAEQLFTKPRGYMPPFVPLCDYTTFLLNPKALLKSGGAKDVECGPVRPGELPALYAFLNAEGRGYHYYPVIKDIPAQFSGVAPEDIFVLRRHGAIVAAGLLWCQAHYRQNMVKAYHGAMKAAALVPRLPTLLGYLPVPKAGAPLHFAMLGLVTVQNNDPALYPPLLAGLAAAARRRGLEIVVAGAAKGSCLWQVLSKRPNLRFGSRLFTMQAKPNPATRPGPGRPVFLECGWL